MTLDGWLRGRSITHGGLRLFTRGNRANGHLLTLGGEPGKVTFIGSLLGASMKGEGLGAKLLIFIAKIDFYNRACGPGQFLELLLHRLADHVHF